MVLALLTGQSWLFYLYNVLWAMSVTFFSGAEEALIYDSLKQSNEEGKMDVAMGKLQTAALLPTAITFLLGSLLAKDLSKEQFLLLTGLGLLAQLGQLAFLFRVRNPASFHKFRDNPFNHVKQGWRLIRQTPDLLKLFVNFTLIFVVTVNIFGVMEQPLLLDAGFPVEWLGLLYAAIALIGVAISENIQWLTSRFSRVRLLYLTQTMILLVFVAAALWMNQLSFAILAFALIGLTRMIRNPIYSHLQNEYIPSESRATTLSLLSIGDSFFDVVLLISFANLSTAGKLPIFIGCALAVLVAFLFPVRQAAERSMNTIQRS
ncbi:hypothetical protein GCM10023228_02920 [Brevibacillus fulvus]